MNVDDAYHLETEWIEKRIYCSLIKRYFGLFTENVYNMNWH